MSGIYTAIRPLLPQSSALAVVVALAGLIVVAVFLNVIQQLVRLCIYYRIFGSFMTLSSLSRLHSLVYPRWTFFVFCFSRIFLFFLLQHVQLPLRSKNAPPMVFHYFPIIGSAVSYGMDPYKFMFENREKVRFRFPVKTGHIGCPSRRADFTFLLYFPAWRCFHFVSMREAS